MRELLPALYRAGARASPSGWRPRIRIGIIGAGHIGGALTRRLRSLGHEVAVANSRAPETLAALVTETGATAVWAAHAADGADLVVVTIPEVAILALAPDVLAGARPGTPIVDTGNYYPRQRDGRIDAIEDGLAESRWVANVLGRGVVKAFNNINALHLQDFGRPPGTPGRIALPVAGDEPEEKGVVMALVDELGFDPVDAGDLDDSWRQQPASPVYGTDLDADGVRDALRQASPQRSADFRA